MPITLKYIGAQNRWPELAVTGKQSVWAIGQTEERTDAEAQLLVATGLFDAVDAPLMLDAASGAVTAGGEPVGRGLMCSGSSGVTSGWVAAAPYGERFALELLVATGGAAASLTLDGSNDGVTSSGQIATASLDTTGVTTITPPIKSIYPYIRWTIVGAGSGSVRISRGV